MKQCAYCDSTRHVRMWNGEALCYRHHYQMRVYGSLHRVNRDRNEIVIQADHAEVVLYDRNNQEACRALIDLEDVEKVRVMKWRVTREGYVITSTDRQFIHHLVLMVPRTTEVDHRNLNPLDNRKSNLRACTRSQNMCNTGLRRSNTSGVKGVWFDKSTRKYAAAIMVNYKKMCLGHHATLDEAARVVSEARLTYHGEFARQ